MFEFFANGPQDTVKKLSRAISQAWKSQLANFTNMPSGERVCLAIYLVMVGLVSWLLHRYLFFTAMELAPNWITDMALDLGQYNITLVNYTLVVLSIVGGVSMAWLFNISPLLKKLFITLAEKTWLLVAIAAVIALCVTSVLITKLYLALSLLVIAPHCIAQYNATLHDTQWQGFIRTKLPLILLVLLAGAYGLAAKTWYPITIPNDYIEVEDSANYIKSATTTSQSIMATAKRSEFLNCFIHRSLGAKDKIDDTSDAMGNPAQSNSDETPALKKTDGGAKSSNKASLQKCLLDTTVPELQKLVPSITQTGIWQSQAGRLLYHHSFVFVPAIHVLTYGPLSPMPHLYGLGNSLFHAGLLALTEPTITAYFKTYPIAQATGIACIILLVLYITRSMVAAMAAGASILALLCSIGYEFILLPPGFSPMRYVGLTAQAAAIVLMFRGTSILRPIAFLFSIAFSFLWNSEFAFIGLVGQLFALMSPTLAFSHFKRFALLALSAGVTFAACHINQTLSEGFLQGVGLGFFGLFPAPTWAEFTLLSVCILAVLALLVKSVAGFEYNERAARLCLLPIAALLVIKYLLYALAVHLLFVLIFIVPVMLTYIRWQHSSASVPSPHAVPLRAILATVLVLVCCGKTVVYASGAHSFRQTMIQPYVLHQWDSLHETFQTPVPEEPIATRVAAIRSVLKPDDSVLFLSPFDHILSFYVNPKRFCSHFEITVNPITHPMVKSIIECAQNTQQTLIVYDTAENMPCPDSVFANYYNQQSCALKLKLKQNSATILKALEASYTAVGTSGPLTFYRRKPSR